MRARNTEPSLRAVAGILGVLRAQHVAGYSPTQLVGIYKEDDPTIGRGTPSRTKIPPQFVRIAQDKKPDSIREYENVFLQASTSIHEAVSQLCTVLDPHTPPYAKTLALLVVRRVEEEQILAIFSSAVAAVACIQVAAVSLNTEPLLSTDALIQLKILPDSVRIAYNHIWLHRAKLEDVIWSKGGDPGLLTSPTAADGSLDTITFCKGVGLHVPAREHRRPRHVSFKFSPLRFVSYPPAQDDQLQDQLEDSEGDGDLDKMSIYSWQSWKPEDCTECENASEDVF